MSEGVGRKSAAHSAKSTAEFPEIGGMRCAFPPYEVSDRLSPAVALNPFNANNTLSI